jgi:hypothetical protein
MTPDQMQQIMNQQIQLTMQATPLWVKAIYLLWFLSILVTVICLPLITWKLYFGKKQAAAELSAAEQMRLIDLRERREALKQIQKPVQAEIHKTRDDDSRFRPAE